MRALDTLAAANATALAHNRELSEASCKDKAARIQEAVWRGVGILLTLMRTREDAYAGIKQELDAIVNCTCPVCYDVGDAGFVHV